MDKIKPCPHCGPKNSQVDLVEDDYGYLKIYCGRCGSSSGTIPTKNTKIIDPKEYIIASWNKRTPEDFSWNDMKIVPNFEPVIALYFDNNDAQIEIKMFPKDTKIPEKYIGWLPCPKLN